MAKQCCRRSTVCRLNHTRATATADDAGSLDADQDTAMTAPCGWWTTVLAMTATLAMPAGVAALPAGAAESYLPSVMGVASADLTEMAGWMTWLRCVHPQNRRCVTMDTRHRRVPCW
ncbi:hypothetical protein DGN16_11610 [Xanthomonas citri pv. fuscans]|uniref:Secreted protein n=1 Tax=Xanthomonas citri pv. phaseoli var. fuscans TaxID=473423 RepID=A0A808FKR1_XANCI|nr:hypothetical protein DGN16_11610 [Xanthomonas citri pv. fuscans]QWN07800.1 hypothetical protein DGN11_10430 [Xanthomonas citri pv. fuscans]QWN12515.1 hypothetical protein DGN07_14055 [Xanthomonas citri pv. fuscans]